MIKSIFEFKKEGINCPIFGDDSIPEYQYDNKYLTSDCSVSEFDQFTLNVYYSGLLHEISKEVSDAKQFESFCPAFVKKQYNGFAKVHPLQKKRDIQGASEVIYRVQEYIKDITGLFAVTTQTNSGLSVKLATCKILAEYFNELGVTKQKIVYATKQKTINLSFAGFTIERVELGSDLQTNLNLIEKAIDEDTACVIIDTFFAGLSTEPIAKVVEIAHKNGALVYCESSCFSKALSIVRPADLGVDIFEFNAEEVLNIPSLNGFSPLAVCEKLEKYLPQPYAIKDKSGSYTLLVNEKDNWQISTFIGSLNACVSLYAYLTVLGSDGLKNYAEATQLNCEYLSKLSKGKLNLKPSECEDFCDL